MEIRAPRIFSAHSDLDGSLAALRQDPREENAVDGGVVIDLSGCAAVGPAAALWCAVYANLITRSGTDCRIIAPLDAAAAAYLSAIKLFHGLRESGIHVDGAVPAPSGYEPAPLLPLTPFRSREEGERLALDSAEAVGAHDRIPANLLADIPETFGELVNNAAEHSSSPVGGFGLIQFRCIDGSYQLLCAVADGGVGIREALNRNPNLERTSTDSAAILSAMQERVSGTGSPTRGIGLCWVMAGASRVSIHSGYGAVAGEGDQPPREIDPPSGVPFPGTLAQAALGKR